MPLVYFKGKTIEADANETVLDCLLRNGEKIRYSCKGGACQSCLLQNKSDDFILDNSSQIGLRDQEKKLGYFMSCTQIVKADIHVGIADTGKFKTDAKIIGQKKLNESVIEIEVQLTRPFPYYAGQFVNLIRYDGLLRSYSIANRSNLDTITFHVKKITNGQMSEWLFNHSLIGESVEIEGPYGLCHLTPEMEGDHLIFIGIGTGLAPLYGMIQEHISLFFKNEVTLFHSSYFAEGLYLVEELKKIENTHSNFHYYPLYLEGKNPSGIFFKEDLIGLIKNLNIETQKTRAFICGDPMMVNKLKQTLFIKGLPSKNIHSDSFASSIKKTS